MSTLRDPSILKSVKGKILLGFFIASLALGATWFISKLAFKNVLDRVELLTTPNDQLRLVNAIFKDIILLDHLQNMRKGKGEEEAQNQLVAAKSRELMTTLDSLSDMSFGNHMQVIRIDSMKKILKKREEIYEHYVKVRSKLVNTKTLEEEVKNISGLITTNLQPDSTVVKTEKRTTTTTTYTQMPDSVQQAAAKKGLFGRMFGGSKKAKKTTPVAAKVVQKQEVNVEVDTIRVAKKDSAIQKVDKAVHAIEKAQKVRTTSFVDREQALAVVGNSLVTQLLGLMQAIENDVVQKSNEDSQIANQTVAQSIDMLRMVVVGFLLVTAILAYLIFADITKSNHYRQELEEAKEEAEYHSMAKQRFLANMSHEIRTPLQSIIGYTEALKKADKPRKQDLETLSSASEHLLYLVNEVLDYSRIISDRFTFEKRVFAINPLLNEITQVLRPNASSKGLALKLENKLPANLYLTGDPFRLRQILYNLLSNAIKFTETGEVTLKVSGVELNNEMQIEYLVSDTGIGLSGEQVQKIFNQFEQADPSISRRYGGTGLGLSIVKALVEGMSGTIRVKSTLGQGTTFVVTTNMKKAATLEMTEETPERDYKVAGKVWLVDDDSFILKWCSSVLEMNGIPHTAFSSAEEVLNRPWDNQVKFVLTDMRMSGMNGAELCKRLRRYAGGDVKFFVLTAQALPEERDALLDLGFDGYLMKPFHSSELLELLESSSSQVPLFTSQPAVTERAPVSQVDFTLLNEMTFGDESMLREVLDQFVKDSRHDMVTLYARIEAFEPERIADILHRMAGRTGQIGARSLSERFRNYEIALRDHPEQVTSDELFALADEASAVIEEVEEKALAYSI